MAHDIRRRSTRYRAALTSLHRSLLFCCSVNVVSTFQSLGVPLYALSIQNEPNFAWGSYPSTTLSPLNESVLANALKPALRAKGLSTLLLAWDSDWWGLDYPLEVLDRVGGDGKSVDGVAFHCYTPNPGPRVQSDLHSRYPNTLILQTEVFRLWKREDCD